MRSFLQEITIGEAAEQYELHNDRLVLEDGEVTAVVVGEPE